MVDLKEYKKNVEIIFKNNHIDVGEVNILFCEAFNCKQSELLLKKEISKKDQKRINGFIKKRLEGMPIQKIFKRAYFFDYTFFVNNNVLCPRPETEILTEECINYVNSIQKKSNYACKVLDLCTGSGCIAITINKKTGAETFASDISSKALYVARKNCKKLGSKVKFIKSNMFKSIKQKFDVIISNPPYIKKGDISHLDREVKKYDPLIALDGGDDGLDFYRIIANQSKEYLNQNGKVFLEVGLGEAKLVSDMLTKNGFDCVIKKDYNNIERIVIGELK